jgi:hypothetical protein
VGERQCSERWKVRRYGRATVGFSEDSGLVQGRAGVLDVGDSPNKKCRI